jgi:DNA-binding MarR family transcriptional regulator
MDNERAIRHLALEASAVAARFNDLAKYWAAKLDITGPQWTMIQAVMELDRGEGVPVKDVAKRMQIDPSFVTTQSKTLEKKGFLQRTADLTDARCVNMSVSNDAKKILDRVDCRGVFEFVFAEFPPREVTFLTAALSALAGRLEKARIKATVED